MAVGVQSHWFAVGTEVPRTEASVGAVPTQSFVDKSYGPKPYPCSKVFLPKTKTGKNSLAGFHRVGLLTALKENLVKILTQ